MSDELLRHLATNSGKLRRTKHFDAASIAPEKERERLEGGVWLCLLQVLCFHANQKERQVWCGIERLAKEAGTNKVQTYRYIELFEALGWITPRPARRAEAHHKPARCWEITFPDLEALKMFQARLEQQEREWEESSSDHSSDHSPIHTSPKLGKGSSSDAEGSKAGEHKHKHKNPPAKKSHLKIVPTHAVREKSLIEQTLETYSECAASKAVNSIANPHAWKAKLIGNAYTVKPHGSELTYSQRAQRALDAGYKPLDIGRWLADGCPSNGSMSFWDKRPEFINQIQQAQSADEVNQSETDLNDIERHLGQKFRAKEAENE